MIKNISRAFKHKNYRIYYFFQFFSFIGTWLQSTAQSWLIYKLTGSPIFLGLVSFAGSLPSLAFAPFAGISSDHFKRKKVLLVTQILCLIHGAMLAMLFFSGVINKWHILCLAVFLGIVNSFDVTSRQSFIPLLVDKEDLVNAIALNSSMFNGARMIGPAIAGVLIASHGEGVCFVLNVLSYVPIITFLFWVKARDQIVKKIKSPYSQLKEGIIFIWMNRPVRSLLLLVGTFSFWGMSFSTLMPIFSDQVLKSGSKGLGILMCSSGIGAVIGGLFLASRGKVLGIKKIIAFCSIVFSISLCAFAFSKSLFLSIFLLVVVGFCFVIINAGNNTTIQALSPDYLRGSVIGFYSMMFMGMFPVGSLTIGYLAHCFGVASAVAVGSIVCLVAGIYFMLKVPALTKDSIALYEAKEKPELLI